MLNTNHWASILQPGSSQVLPASSCTSIKVYFSPDFSAKKGRPRKPIEIKPKKITIIGQLTDYLESAYPRWVSTSDLLTLPFLEKKTRPNVLAVLQHIHVKNPLEARVLVNQAFRQGQPYKEYRLIKKAESL